ncbi:MAG: 6-phosphofructokinase [Candidatus Omnitrophica bacterium]|nr:6-phosphofructokinase [Candidatus Omnitrophota bacterium]
MSIKKIGVLTSGGDGPGMNAAVRSVARSALSSGLKVAGIIRGYQGLIDNNVVEMNHRAVSNIINRGGTILKTARSEKFRTPEGKAIALNTLQKHNIDALVVIGGDGTYRGAVDFNNQFPFPIVGIPGSIDNDIVGTDETIGCETAINTALGAIDNIRDTAQSMERIFIVEVMGNRSGYIALRVALASGAEDAIIPEKTFDYRALNKEIEEGTKKGKISWIIVTAEGAAKAPEVAKTVSMTTGLETRFAVLGHIQRGGCPVAADRILATRLGAAAVDLLHKGESGKAVGVIHEEITVTDLRDAVKRPDSRTEEYINLMKKLM